MSTEYSGAGWAEATSSSTDAAGARRIVAAATLVLTVGILLAVGSYAVEWEDVLVGGETPELDEWIALAGVLWLPMLAMTLLRLLRLQKELREAAAEAVAAFRDTVHTAHGWAWQVDTDHRITFSSDGIRTLLGHEPGDVVGRNAMELLVLPEDHDEILAAVQGSREQGGWEDWRTRVRHHDGSVRYVRSSAIPVLARDGSLLAYRGFTTDVTAEVLAAEADEARRTGEQAAQDRITAVLASPESVAMVFQPIVDTRADRITGVEALARFAAEPRRPPNEWFAEAWEVGLGPALELHALDLACRQLPLLPADAYVSLNVSPLTMLDDRFARLLTELGEDVHRVVIEVTEHAAIDDYDALASVLADLRRRGARLAVDDAGAGYSSLQHIVRLRPDVIKLDRGIVGGADRDPARRALVVAMGNFAASLGMTVVAEGVETAGELAVLVEAGICCAQGYYLGRPGPAPLPAWPPLPNPLDAVARPAVAGAGVPG